MTIWKFEGKDAVKITGREEARTPLAGCSEGRVDIDDLIHAADTAIKGGDHLKAMKLYRFLLSRGIEEKILLQRVAEFKWYMRLLGQGKYLKVLLLQNFLSGIRQRYESERESPEGL
jgi:hypothetical protein